MRVAVGILGITLLFERFGASTARFAHTAVGHSGATSTKYTTWYEVQHRKQHNSSIILIPVSLHVVLVPV